MTTEPKDFFNVFKPLEKYKKENIATKAITKHEQQILNGNLCFLSLDVLPENSIVQPDTNQNGPLTFLDLVEKQTNFQNLLTSCEKQKSQIFKTQKILKSMIGKDPNSSFQSKKHHNGSVKVLKDNSQLGVKINENGEEKEDNNENKKESVCGNEKETKNRHQRQRKNNKETRYILKYRNKKQNSTQRQMKQKKINKPKQKHTHHNKERSQDKPHGKHKHHLKIKNNVQKKKRNKIRIIKKKPTNNGRIKHSSTHKLKLKKKQKYKHLSQPKPKLSGSTLNTRKYIIKIKKPKQRVKHKQKQVKLCDNFNRFKKKRLIQSVEVSNSNSGNKSKKYTQIKKFLSNKCYLLRIPKRDSFFKQDTTHKKPKNNVETDQDKEVSSKNIVNKITKENEEEGNSPIIGGLVTIINSDHAINQKEKKKQSTSMNNTITETGSNLKKDPESDFIYEPESDFETEIEADRDLDLDLDLDSDTDTDTNPERYLSAGDESDINTNTDTGMGTFTDMDSNSNIDTHAQMRTETETETEKETETTTETESGFGKEKKRKRVSNSNSESEFDNYYHTNKNPSISDNTNTNNETEQEPETKTETYTSSNTEMESESETETETETATEPKAKYNLISKESSKIDNESDTMFSDICVDDDIDSDDVWDIFDPYFRKFEHSDFDLLEKMNLGAYFDLSKLPTNLNIINNDLIKQEENEGGGVVVSEGEEEENERKINTTHYRPRKRSFPNNFLAKKNNNQRGDVSNKKHNAFQNFLNFKMNGKKLPKEVIHKLEKLQVIKEKNQIYKNELIKKAKSINLQDEENQKKLLKSKKYIKEYETMLRRIERERKKKQRWK
ncbi:cerebellar degeneration-related antigen [Anaeramoeba flamelloides]|uniref:Cerebellar degeneration-related antigen n=1 Tax=Anaeramoeba flamelloides TaxID=1746091 RepID=A0AAV7ZEA5_9EUKA|nr:cerebellar degeneration-related antigen [Anaeramoeba flamelloides]